LSTRYVIEPDGSVVTAVVRPRLDDVGPIEVTVTGEVELAGGDIGGDPVHPGEITGRVRITPARPGATTVEIDLSTTRPELAPHREDPAGVDGDGEDTVVLLGSATRPATEFGILGSPLLNPTIVLSWRLRLVPLS
jgi:hypothetical protein